LIQRAVRDAVLQAGLIKRASCLTFRQLLGHNDAKTMMIYTYVLNRSGHGVESPLDRLRNEPARDGRGLYVLSGQPKRPEANCRMMQKSLDRTELTAPRGDGGFALGCPGTVLMQVGLNKS